MKICIDYTNNEKKGDAEVKVSYEVTGALTGVLDFLKTERAAITESLIS